MDGTLIDHDTPFGASPLAPGSDSVEFTHEGEPAEFSPFAALGRLMRGRWLTLMALIIILGGALGALGYGFGKKTYESQAILRISAREPGILFASGDDSKLKLFESYVKAETTYVASHPVMQRAVDIIKTVPSEHNQDLTARTLADSIEIRRKEALIILKSASSDPEFAARKINAVVDAYLVLHEETKEKLANFRESELAARETDLLARLENVKAQMLEVGGEFGMASLVKTHIEKVAQIEELVARRGEVAATLASLQNRDDTGSADMADQEIMRATLLDRALADLNFEKAKREAELTVLLSRFTENAKQVKDKRKEIVILDTAMADRREQIKVLGQTGALTEGSQASREDSIAEIEALLNKVTGQLEDARADAKELNRKRIELTFLDEERDELRRMLDETRHALDVIRVESRNSMPGLVDTMSRAVVSEKAAENSARMLAAGGFVGGALLAAMLVLGIALSRGTIRFSDDLWRHVWQMPVLATFGARQDPVAFQKSIFRLRNNILLFPVRRPVSGDRARIIAVSRFDKGDSRLIAGNLADSFANAHQKTLFIDADLMTGDTSQTAGWREAVMGDPVQPLAQAAGADRIETGANARITDATVSLAAIRAALQHFAPDYAVIVVNAGSLDTGFSAELITSASDLALGVVEAGDAANRVNDGIARINSLARQGGGFVFTKAGRKDPALAA